METRTFMPDVKKKKSAMARFLIHCALFIVHCALFIVNSNAQTLDSSRLDSSRFSLPIVMDTVVIRATMSGWDVEGFISRVKNDTTFYKAFRSLHLVPYTSVNEMKIFDKDGETQASSKTKREQIINRGCRSMMVKEERVTGDFYDRKGDYNYYTAEMFANAFFTNQPVCGEDDIVAGKTIAVGKGKMEKHKAQLKQLIFNPGSKVEGVPFMGDKTAIFDPQVAKMYEFKLLSTEIDGEDCYLFQATPKPEYASEVVYNNLSTWFRKKDYAIVARNYSLSYHTMVYNFDVTMKVRLLNSHGKLLPSRIEYTGNWYAMTKGKERSTFTATFYY